MNKNKLIRILVVFYIVIFLGTSIYIYILLPYIQNLIFIFVVLVMFIISLLKSKNFSNFEKLENVPLIILIATPISLGLFTVFWLLGVNYGGSATNYGLEDIYYLKSHGEYTEVTYKIWIRMKILENITIPVFLINFVMLAVYKIKKRF